MKNLLFISLIVPMIIFGQSSEENQKAKLKELNEYLFSEYVLKKNVIPLEETATDDFVLIAAPGMIENKRQAIDGVTNLNVSSLNVTVDRILITGDIGIVVGILEMKGTIMKRPVPGKIRYSSTFIKKDEKWRLKLRTMTPIKVKPK